MRIPLLSSMIDGFRRPKNTEERLWTGMLGMPTSSGVIVTADSAYELDIVQAVLEALSGTISTLPIKVFERRPNGGKAEITDHYLATLLRRRPNSRMTVQEFFDEQQRHLMFWRNAYSRIVIDEGGRPVSLEPYHPSRLQEIVREDGRFYYIFRPAGGTGQVEKIQEDLVWHVRKAPLTVDGVRGVPIFESARETFGRALAVEKYGARYFKNSGKTGGTLQHPGHFKSAEDREEFLRNWRASVSGENQHADRLLTHGVTYTPANISNDEAQFIETINQMETKVCGLWSMPPHRVSRLARATNNNIEHQGLEYVVHTVAPYVAAWEQSAENVLLVTQEDFRRGVFVEFAVDGLLRGDISARYRAYAIARQWGWLSVNDIRKIENLDPLGSDGDVYLQPLNMQPAGTPAEPGA